MIDSTRPINRLPKDIKDKAIVDSNEFGWRQQDFPSAVDAAAASGLACLWTEVQFHVDGQIAEAYWLGFGSEPRKENEDWNAYVTRCAKEILSKFHSLWNSTDFIEIARSFEGLKDQLEKSNFSPLDHLCFTLDVAEESL